MGKGLITGESGEGLYTVDLDYGSDYVNRRIAELDLRIAALDGLITTVNADATTVNNAARAAEFALDDAIDVLQSAAPDDVDAAQRAVTAASEVALKAQAEVGKINRELARYRLEKSQAEKKKSDLEAIPIQEEKEVWCTTYTEEAEGSVGTIEINGEGRSQILIAPEAPEYNAAEYGDLRHRLAMSASTAYLNAALLPGWQKWKPNYRVGVISDIDTAADTCSVTLDEALSSAQELDINRRTFIEDVPVVYLDCNASAFEDDDRVVVRFANGDWEDPTVIGFESEPRPCGRNLWISSIAFRDGVQYNLAARVSENLTVLDDYEWVIASDDAWSNVARIDNGNAVIPFGKIPTTSGGNSYAIRLRDIKNGGTEFTSPFSVTSGTRDDASIDKSQDRLYIMNSNRGIDVYKWSDGSFIGTHTKIASSGNALSGLDSNGEIFVYMQNFGGVLGQPPVMRIFAVDAVTLVELWSTDITGTGLDPSWLDRSISVSDEHVAVILSGSVPNPGPGASFYTSILAVMDVSDGFVLRQTRYFTWNGVSPADFGDYISLRGRKAYVVSAYASASESISTRLRTFDVLDGDPNAPDGIVENVFPTVGPATPAARPRMD